MLFSRGYYEEALAAHLQPAQTVTVPSETVKGSESKGFALPLAQN